MAKKKKQSKQKQLKMERQCEKVTRIAHEILTKKIEPANLSLDEAIDVVSIVVKAIVLSNTSDDDPEDRTGMIEWIVEHFVEELMDIDPSADHAHAWIISPQGRITEPVGILWTGSHEEDSVKVVLGTDLTPFMAEMKDAADVHVIEGVEGIAMIDSEWDGTPTITCDNPECGRIHDVHLMVAENLFEQAKQRAKQATN